MTLNKRYYVKMMTVSSVLHKKCDYEKYVVENNLSLHRREIKKDLTGPWKVL